MIKKYFLPAILVLLFASMVFAQTTTTVPDMTADTNPTADDLIYVVNDPLGTPADRKVTLGNAITKAHGLTADYVPMLNASGVLTSNSTAYWKQVATPANPSSGYNKLYFKSDDKLYKLTSGGTETEIAAGSSGKGYIWVPSGTMIPDTCSGLLQNDSDPNIFDYLAFDGATDEYALFNLSLEDWDLSTIKAKFVWAASASMTDTQTIIWGLNCYAVSDGDTIDVAFDTGAQTASDIYGTGDETGPKQKTTSATSALTVQGTPIAGDVVYCRVHRDADTDTSTIDAWLIGVKIEYGKTTPTAW